MHMLTRLMSAVSMRSKILADILPYHVSITAEVAQVTHLTDANRIGLYCDLL